MKSPEDRVAIRVDVTDQIGTGHFMRCLALADTLRAHGARVRFLTCQMPSDLQELATGRGHVLNLLPAIPDPDAADDLAHSHWLRTSQRADARLTREALAGERVDWLVVDHYALDARWESALRPGAANVLAIDDLADRAHDCDALLDQNLHDDMQARYASRVPARCRLLLGPKYALLREEFRLARESMRVRDGIVKRVLVLMGGVDAHRFTEKAIDALSRVPHAFEVDVVIGGQNRARDDVARACREHGYALHVQPHNIAVLMASADLAIGAAGSTTWERCCLGLPTICVTEAANQVSIAAALHAAGAIVNLGAGNSVGPADLTNAISSLFGQRERLVSLSERAAGLVDGKGAGRVGAVLLECS